MSDDVQSQMMVLRATVIQMSDMLDELFNDTAILA